MAEDQARGLTMQDQVVVVTGAGRGIGHAIARAMAAAGADVALLSRTDSELSEVAEEIRGAGGTALPVRCDVTRRAEVDAAMAEVVAELGPIDVLVNNAGTNLTLGLVWEVDPDDWWTDVETSLLGPFLCVRAVGREMVGRGHGRIINISSGAATEPRPYTPGYAAAKTAAQRFSESITAPFLEHGVRVFSLNPGPVTTTLMDHSHRSAAGRRFVQPMPENQRVPAERAAAHAVLIASGAVDALVGRYLSVFEDLETVLEDERLSDPEFLTLRVKGWRWER